MKPRVQAGTKKKANHRGKRRKESPVPRGVNFSRRKCRKNRGGGGEVPKKKTAERSRKNYKILGKRRASSAPRKLRVFETASRDLANRTQTICLFKLKNKGRNIEKNGRGGGGEKGGTTHSSFKKKTSRKRKKAPPLRHPPTRKHPPSNGRFEIVDGFDQKTNLKEKGPFFSHTQTFTQVRPTP